MTRDEIERFLQITNVQAFLRVIREGESDQTDAAYRRISGGGHFQAPPWVHPYDGVPTTQGGKACGAYQHLGTTWARQRERNGFEDFSPHNQDLAAVDLINGRQALADVVAGRFEHAVAKCRPEWTSLPGAAESHWTMEKAIAVFKHYGGGIAQAEGIDIQEASMDAQQQQQIGAAVTGIATAINPLAGLFVGLASTLIQGFSAIGQKKVADAATRVTGDAAFGQQIGQQVGQIGQQLSQTIVGAAQQVTGKSDPIEAVAEAKKSPEAIQKIEQITVGDIDKLMPLYDRINEYELKARAADIVSMDAAAARGRADAFDLAPMLAGCAVGLVGLILIALFVLMGIQAYDSADHEPSTAMLTLAGPLLGTVFTAAFAAVYGYRFGSSRSSSAKDAALADVAKIGASK